MKKPEVKKSRANVPLISFPEGALVSISSNCLLGRYRCLSQGAPRYHCCRGRLTCPLGCRRCHHLLVSSDRGRNGVPFCPGCLIPLLGGHWRRCEFKYVLQEKCALVATNRNIPSPATTFHLLPCHIFQYYILIYYVKPNHSKPHQKTPYFTDHFRGCLLKVQQIANINLNIKHSPNSSDRGC